MVFLQPFNTLLLLFLGASLALSAAPETRSLDTNSCTMLACGNPGPADFDLSDLDGEKGDMAVDTVQRQDAALEKTVQTLQAEVNKCQKIFKMQGVTTIGGKTFVSTGQSANFTDGKSLCSQAGGALAVAMNVAENTALAAMAKRNGKDIFLGVSDIHMEGKFVYLNGQAVSYTKWKSSEPNNYNYNEDCVILLTDSQWNDIGCDHQTLIVCEL